MSIQPAAAIRSNVIAYWPVAFVVLVVVSEILASSWDIFFFVLIVIFPVAAFGMIAFGFFDFVRSVRYGLWRRSLTILLIPMTVLVAILFPPRFNTNLNYIGQLLRLQISKQSYSTALDRLPNDGKRFMVFDWAGFGGLSTFLIYDETDRFMAKPGHRNECTPKGDESYVCDCEWVPFTGHYYFCSL